MVEFTASLVASTAAPVDNMEMMKKILAAAVLFVVLVAGGLFVWARSVLTGDAVRATLAAQVEKAIGQPVSIGSLDATVMPRVSLTLGTVSIGRPGRIAVGSLQVGTDFRALLSRRIEHASLRLSGAHIELPLPPFSVSAASAPAGSAPSPSKPPVELVSIDEIVLQDVEVVSGGRTIRGDIEVVPQGQGLLIRKMTFGAGATTIDIAGRISDVNGPVGDLTIKAGRLDFDQLLSFVNDFTAGVVPPASTAGASPAAVTATNNPRPPADSRPSPSSASGTAASGTPSFPADARMTVTLQADAATIGGLTLTGITGKATVADGGLAIEPASFGIFGGQYQGSLSLTSGRDGLRFTGRSALSNVDVSVATAFAGSPNTITGRLGGRLEFDGRGSTPAAVLRSTTAKGRVDITNGTVKNLGLIHSVVVATSMRAGAVGEAASSASANRDEPFSTLGATLSLSGGTLTTDDLLFESKDVRLAAQGAVRLLESVIDLKGRAQLSDALSQQAGRDLVRYTQDQGRVTLPVTVTGTFDAPSVRVDAGDMAKRALRNAASEQAERAKADAAKAVTRKLGGLFGR